MLARSHKQRTLTGSPRGGYTLVEMLLVLSALLAIAGIVWPVLQTWYGHHALKEAVHDVRMRLANTRVRAIDSTVTYQFLYEPFGRNYLVLPFEAAAPDATLVSGTADTAQMQAVQARRVLHGRLPEGYEFRSALK
ncbi:MAG: hypothetical protein KY476_02255, partial [Planctomycetes bacterium]|nr:hypothetical protein [Planctomycetota bacterium]